MQTMLKVVRISASRQMEKACSCQSGRCERVTLESGDHVAPAVAYWIDQVDGRPVLLRSDRNSDG